MEYRSKFKAMALALPLTLIAGASFASDLYGDHFENGAFERPFRSAHESHWPPFPTISDNGRPVLSPEGVTLALREQGWSDIRRVYYTGGLYTAVGRSPKGVDWNVRVDATTGLVLSPYHHHHGYGPGDAALYLEEPAPVPRARLGRYRERSADRSADITDDPYSARFDKVRKRLQRKGYRDIEGIRSDGNVLVMTAEDRYGEVVRLTVDARTGRIIERDYIG
jgi:hypothetical protein